MRLPNHPSIPHRPGWLLGALLLTGTLSAAPAGPQEAEGSDERASAEAPAAPGPAPAAGEVPDGVEWAKRLAKAWPGAKYTILKGKKKIGSYEQKNLIKASDGRTMLEYMDVVRLGKGSAGYQAQTVQELVPGLPTRMLQARTEVDGIQLFFARGRMQGQALMKAMVDFEAPALFVTDTKLLRGQPQIPREKGATVVLDFIDIEALPRETSVSKGRLRCMGPEAVEIEGEPMPAWKFRWQPDGTKKPTFFWYGDDGQLLRRQSRTEVWVFSHLL